MKANVISFNNDSWKSSMGPINISQGLPYYVLKDTEEQQCFFNDLWYEQMNKNLLTSVPSKKNAEQKHGFYCLEIEWWQTKKEPFSILWTLEILFWTSYSYRKFLWKYYSEGTIL